MSNREPDTEGRRHDDWTCLDAPDAAAAAIAKLEALGLSAAEVAARDSYLGLLDLRPGQTVLDVGGGTGCSAIEIARRVGRTGRVVALDPSVPLGAFGREAATRAGVGEVLEWRLGSAEALPFPDGTFDRAFCRWVLLHVEAAEAVVREMRRVVRPGGRIMCVEADWETVTVYPGERGLTRRILNFSTDRHIEGWSRRRLVPLLRGCGLANVAVQPIVTVDDAASGPEWVAFLHQRADMAASASVVSEAEAASWRQAIDRAAALRSYFFSSLNSPLGETFPSAPAALSRRSRPNSGQEIC
jgi:SAM-dependent methyltransferase